jgi:hypothetical protein
MYICAAAQGKENSMEQRRISFLTVEWAKMDGWSSMQESAGIDMYVKFIYSEKAAKFCEISPVDLRWRFAKFCGLLRIHELYVPTYVNGAVVEKVQLILD